jgi:uncharacterized phiE125 gp8 family phage protein
MTISLDEAKAHLRIEHTDEDAHISALIQAATRNAESITGTRITQAQVTKKFSEFGPEMYLEWPLISVDQIKYIDKNGAEQTLYDTINSPNVTSAVFQVVRKWQARLAQGKPYITLAYDQAWPETQKQPEAVTVIYTAGYSPTVIPDDLRAASLLMIGHLYANREATVKGNIINDLPLGYVELLQSHKLYSL